MPSARLLSWADLVHAARQEGAVVFHDLLRGCLPFLDTYRTMPGPRAGLEDILELRLAA